MNHKVTKPGKLFVISGASGAGKTTLAAKLIQKIACAFPIERVITYTTRLPRPDEINGRDYIFISEDEFKQLDNRQFFLESSRFNGGIYGSPITLIDKLNCGISLLIVTDLNGIRSLKKRFPNCVTLWIAADQSELRTRLEERGTEDKETIAKRITLAAKHTAEAKKEKIIDHFITNKNLEEALKDLAKVILTEAP